MESTETSWVLNHRWFHHWTALPLDCFRGGNKTPEVYCWPSKWIPHFSGLRGLLFALQVQKASWSGLEKALGQQCRKACVQLKLFGKAGTERKSTSFPFLPILGDRACHNSAEQTRAACQHLICWRLRNYSILTIPCQSRNTFELWGMQNVDLASDFIVFGNQSFIRVRTVQMV